MTNTEKDLVDVLKYHIAVDQSGTRKYFNAAGQLHRDEGPAVIMTDGTKEWCHNGLRHRENGPAVEWPNGSKEWWQNGKRHREDGPAYERLGLKVWYLHGEWYSEQDHRLQVTKGISDDQ